MGIYTPLGDKQDNTVDTHIKYLVKELKKTFGEKLISVVLIGGFARGEGSFYKGYPLNDYDLYVVTNTPIKFTDLKKISLDFIKNFSIPSSFSFESGSHVMNFYADMRNITLGEIPKLPPLLKYFEMKNSGKVLYGKNVLKLMPNYSIEDIPLEDGFRFLYNRMSLLIECFRSYYLKGKMSDEEKQAIMFYISKSYLTIAESLLLFNRKFVSSYEQRAKIFSECYKKGFPDLHKLIPDLGKKVMKYTSFKLKPKFPKDEEYILNEWFNVREDMLQISKYYCEKLYGFSDVSKVGSRLLRPYVKDKIRVDVPLLSYFAGMYLGLLYTKKLVENKIIYPKQFFNLCDPLIKLYSAVPFLLSSVGKDGRVKTPPLLESYSHLIKLYPSPNIERVSGKKLLDIVYKYYSDAFRIYQFLL